MNLKSIVEAELRKSSRTFKWLVNEMGVSNDGLKSGLETESIKFRDFKKLIEVLKLPVERFFEKKYLVGEANHKTIISEPPTIYPLERELLQEQITMLKSTIEDKNRIIELLNKK